MSWAVGEHEGRDIGYGVPSQCDRPGCKERIDRGMGYACPGECGRFFCSAHGPRTENRCRHKADYSSDLNVWIVHKLRDESWAKWRAENMWHVRLLSAIIMEGYKFKNTCSCGGSMAYWTSPYEEGVNPHDESTCKQHGEFEDWLNRPCSTP